MWIAKPFELGLFKRAIISWTAFRAASVWSCKGSLAAGLGDAFPLAAGLALLTAGGLECLGLLEALSTGLDTTPGLKETVTLHAQISQIAHEPGACFWGRLWRYCLFLLSFSFRFWSSSLARWIYFIGFCNWFWCCRCRFFWDRLMDMEVQYRLCVKSKIKFIQSNVEIPATWAFRRPTRWMLWKHSAVQKLYTILMCKAEMKLRLPGLAFVTNEVNICNFTDIAFCHLGSPLDGASCLQVPLLCV